MNEQIEQIINQHDKYQKEKRNASDEDYRNINDSYGKLWNKEITKEQYNIERAKQKIVLDTKLKTIESKYKVKCIIAKLDLKDEKSILEVIEKYKKEYKTLDLLVNNASISNDNLLTEVQKIFYANVDIMICGK